MLLPHEQEFLDLLQYEHGVTLTENDLEALNEFHWRLRTERQTQLANEPDAVFYEVEAGKGILGIVAFAALGFFAAPLLGVGGIVGALMGAAIGWRLFGQQGKKDEPTKKSVNQSGFDSVQGLVPLGGPIPLIYCNRDVNPNGGVRTSGFIINQRVQTDSGSQRLYQLLSLGYGHVASIDPTSIRLDDQPRDNFFDDDIQLQLRYGTKDQQPIDWFPYYSQCRSPSASSTLGMCKRAKKKGGTGSTVVVDADEEEINNIVPSDRYYAAGYDFRVLGKDINANSFTASIDLSAAPTDSVIAAKYICTYETSKECSQIWLNLAANLWCRNKDNDLLTFGVCFDLYLTRISTNTRQFCYRFYIANKTESDIRRDIRINNLPLDKWKIEMIPLYGVDNTYDVRRLLDTGNRTNYPAYSAFSGLQTYVNIDTDGVLQDPYDVGQKTIPDREKSRSSDRGAPVRLTSVNEIVTPADLGQPTVCAYPGMPLVGQNIVASDRLSSSPRTNIIVRQGRIVRNHIAAGFANPASDPDTLRDLTRDFSGFQVGWMVRNLDKRIESPVAAVYVNGVDTAQPLYWSGGDRYLVYAMGSSCLFPDIYVDALISNDGGLGQFIDPDFFIDYPSICAARNFCAAAQFYWDGIVDQSIPWAEWATKESLGSLLFPTRIGGKFGLIPEQQRNPVALFNASNIIAGTFTEEFAPRQRLNTLTVTYTDGSDGRFEKKTVVIQTQRAYDGLDAPVEESLALDSVTQPYQAQRVGEVYLKTRLLQDRTVSFSTGLQGVYLEPGDLIIVQHLITQFDREQSGFVRAVGSFSGGGQGVYLSAPLQLGTDATYTAAVFRLEDGTMQTGLTCRTETDGTTGEVYLGINGLSAPLQPPSENRTGDYVVLGKSITEKRTYRVSQIDPSEDGTVQVTAAIWVPAMLDASDLRITY